MLDAPLSPALLAFAGLLAATGLMRLGELAVSVRRQRARPEAGIAEGWLFPAMATLHAGLVFAPIAEVLPLRRPFVLTVLNAVVLAPRINPEQLALLNVPAWRAALAHKARFIPWIL